MALRIITPPAVEPVTRDQAKRQMRITTDLDNDRVEALLIPARFWAEHETGRQLITATWELLLDAWPGGRVIDLPRPPLQSVESVKYLDADRAEQTLSADAYDVDTASIKGRIVLKPSESWPTLADAPGAVRVRFVAGYGESGNKVPALITSGMLLHIQAHHLGDKDTFGGFMEAAHNCLRPFQVDFV